MAHEARADFDMPLGAIYLLIVGSLLGLALTVKAAPIMLSLRGAEQPAAQQHTFDDFFLWGLYLRGTVDLSARYGRCVGICRGGLGAISHVPSIK
jgi:hypothetical protein